MNNNRFMSSSNAQATQIDLGLRSYMLGVYNHMTTALALTGLMALGLNFLAISNGALTPIGELFFLSPLKWVIMLAPLGMVFYISARINSISSGKARNLFYIYAGLMGLSLSSLLLIYTGASVVRAFFVTAAAFAALSIYGYTTKKSLSGLGSFLMMGVFGLIIAQIVNIFMASTQLDFMISIIGVLIFAGLRDYDKQYIKNMYWTLELASYLSDAPWPANKDELIDFAIRTGAPLEVVENLQAIEDEDEEVFESIQEIWPDFPTEEDYLWNEEEY